MLKAAQKLSGLESVRSVGHAEIRSSRTAPELQLETEPSKTVSEDEMKTGTDVYETGVYSSECCECETAFLEEQTFTRCPRCSSLTRWELVDIDLSLAA